MEENCPTCLEKGIKSSVTFWQISLDSAVLACNNLNCSFPFDRQYRDVIWKRKLEDINKERNPKIKLEDVILKDVKPIDDHFTDLKLPDVIADEPAETSETNAVSNASPLVDFGTLVALSEEDTQPLVVNDKRNPNNPVSESPCINNSNSSYSMEKCSYIKGDLSFLEIDDNEEPSQMRASKGSAVEEIHGGSESDSGIPVIEIVSEDEEEMDENCQRAVNDNAFDENSLNAVNENLQSEIDENSLNGRDEDVWCEVEENCSSVDADDNSVHCEDVTGENPASVNVVETYIVICKDVVPTFDVDQLKRKGISAQILNPNSSFKTTDNVKREISSGKEIVGSDYGSPECISSKPGRPFHIVEDKVRIWLGDTGDERSECEMVITPADLFRYIVKNFVNKPESGEVGGAAVDRKVALVSAALSEEVQTVRENLSTSTIDGARNFCVDTSVQSDSVPSKGSAGTVPRDKSEPWRRKASKSCSMLKSPTTAVPSNSSTTPFPHSTLLTPSGNLVSDKMSHLPWTVAECTEDFFASHVTKRRHTWKKTDTTEHESVLGDSDATTPDSTKETYSGEQTSDELNKGFLEESFSSGSPIRRCVKSSKSVKKFGSLFKTSPTVKSSKSVMKFGSLFKTSPTVRQARLLKYKFNRFRRRVICSAKSKVAHGQKSVMSPDTTLESSDAASSPNNKSVKQSDLLKVKNAQLIKICTPSPESTHFGNIPASILSSSVAEERVTPHTNSCVSESVTKYPSPTKSLSSTKTLLPLRSNCSVRPSYQLTKSVLSSSDDDDVTVHSEEESFTPVRNSCEVNSSTSPDINSMVKSTSPTIDNSTSVSKCILLNKRTQPSFVNSTVKLVRSNECEQKKLDNICMTNSIPSHAVSQSRTNRSMVEERYLQRYKRIQSRRSFKSSTKPTYVEVVTLSNHEESSTSNSAEELSETNETTSEECVSDLASLPVMEQSPQRSDVPQLKGPVRPEQSPQRSDVPQLKGPVRPSPESTNSIKSNKPSSDNQETVPPLIELYVKKSVTSSYDSSVEKLAPSFSGTIAVKQSPQLKSYPLRKSCTPPAKSRRVRKPVASALKSKVPHLRKTRVHLRKRISKSPVSTIVPPPRTTRKPFLPSATDGNLDKSQLSSSTCDVEIRRKTVAPAQNLELDLGSDSASIEKCVTFSRSSNIVTENSVSHSLRTKPVILSNTPAKESSCNKLCASTTSKKLKALHTTRRSTKSSHSLKTISRAMTTSVVEAASRTKTKETGKSCRPTRSSVKCEETSTTGRSNSLIAVSQSKKSTANSTASCVSKSCREVAEMKADASSQAASVTEVSRVRKSCRQKHLPQGSVASSLTKTNSLDLPSTKLSEYNLKENVICSNVSVVILKSPAATAALLKLREESAAKAVGVQPVMQSTDCSSEKSPVKAAVTPLSKAYVKLHRIPIREGSNLRHISQFMKEKAEENCRTVSPSRSQKSDSYRQQIVPPSEPSIPELNKKDSIEKENIANSKKRRKYSVDVRSKPKRRSVQKMSSEEENVPRISSSVALKSQLEQLAMESRVLLTKARIPQTLLSNKNLSEQVNSVCTKSVVNREDVNTRRSVKRVAHRSRVISSGKERRNVQSKLDVTDSSYSVKGLVSQERNLHAFKQRKGIPVRSSARTRSLRNVGGNCS